MDPFLFSNGRRSSGLCTEKRKIKEIKKRVQTLEEQHDNVVETINNLVPDVQALVKNHRNLKRSCSSLRSDLENMKSAGMQLVSSMEAVESRMTLIEMKQMLSDGKTRVDDEQANSEADQTGNKQEESQKADNHIQQALIPNLFFHLATQITQLNQRLQTLENRFESLSEADISPEDVTKRDLQAWLAQRKLDGGCISVTDLGSLIKDKASNNGFSFRSGRAAVTWFEKEFPGEHFRQEKKGRRMLYFSSSL